jgi:uncharacterized protein (UPF0261 family)
MSLGGTTAAALGAAAMKELPIGMPKLLVTTFIDPATIGDEDITVMQTPIDLVGMNKVVERTLSNAAGALMGMIEQEVAASTSRPLIGLTALGVTTPAVQKVISRLEKDGRDGVVFHAKTTMLDRLVKAGLIDGIIDVTTFEFIPMVLYPPELIAQLVGAPEVRRDRLQSAIEAGLPQVVIPGGLDMHIFPGAGIEAVPEQFRDRAWTMHGPYIVLVRTSAQELQEVGIRVADVINRATGPIAALIPLRGFSDASKEGAPLFDPQADRAFIDALKVNVDDKTRVIEVDCHINDDQFTDVIMKTFNGMSAPGR